MRHDSSKCQCHCDECYYAAEDEEWADLNYRRISPPNARKLIKAICLAEGVSLPRITITKSLRAAQGLYGKSHISLQKPTSLLTVLHETAHHILAIQNITETSQGDHGPKHQALLRRLVTIYAPKTASKRRH